MSARRVGAGSLLLLVGSCGAPPMEHVEPTHHAAPDGTVTIEGESRAWVEVEAAEAPTATARRALFAYVTFDEARVATIGAPVSGRVVSVVVTTGTRVARDAPLVVIHSPDVAAAQASLGEARQTRMLAEQTAARTALLLRQGAGSEADAQAAATAAEQARLEERRATEALRAIGAGAGEVDYTLRAPIAGVVVERSVDVGNAVAADSGTPLLTIADLARVWVVVDVYEHDLPYVHVGDVAHVIVPSLDQRTIDGRIAYVGDVVNAATRAARARIELDNPDAALRPGMFAEVEVESPDAARAIVPLSAVLARRDEHYVYVETGEGTYQPRRVVLGMTTGAHVGLLSGLDPGDRIVTRGAILLDAEASAAL